MGESRSKKFRDSMKSPVDYSLIDIKKYRNETKSEGSDEYKEEKERDKAREQERYKILTRKKCNKGGEIFETDELGGGKISRLIEKIIQLESSYLGIAEPDYMFYNDGKDIGFGYYDSITDTMYINRAKPLISYEDYVELLDTVIHENRHKYQFQIMEDSKNRPEVNRTIQEFIKFSNDNYPIEDSAEDYWERYLNNGLETDAFNYTLERLELYLGYDIDEILEMDKPPKRVISNQILMEEGDSSPTGLKAPISVSKYFFSKEFVEYHKEGSSLKNNHIEKKGEYCMSQGTGATDFSERAQGEAVKVYKQVVESIQTFSEKMILAFTERIKMHPYKQLENVTNTFISYYNEKLPGEIKDAIREWISSDVSFSNSLKSHEEDGESASVNAASKLESGLTDMVDEAFRTISNVKIDKPISVDKEQILSDATFTESYYVELGNLRENWLGQFSRYSEQNSIYANMSYMVADTFKHTEKVYQAAQKDILRVGDEFADAWSSVTSRGKSAASERAKIERDISDIFVSHRKSY